MSGGDDHPTGGWNHEWFSSEPFPSPETQFSAPPQTQSSQAPGGYRPYPVDYQGSPDGRYGWAPEPGSGGSGGSSTPTPTSIPTPTPPTRGTRTPYTPDEMMALFKAYLAVSEDPDVGTNQSGETFWWRVTRLYNRNRPGGTIERNDSMVRNAVFRANLAIGKFQGYFLQEERSAGSGRSELDIISAALSTYQSLNLKPFKYLDCWQEARHHEKYRGGVVSSSSSSSKRSRSVALSDGASDEMATQLAATNLGNPDAGPSSSRRPQGRKKAAANRRRGPTPSTPDPDPAPAPFVPPQPPNNSLWALLGQLNSADRSNMTPAQLATHEKMIRGLSRQLGLED